MINLNHLHYFYVCAQYRSVTRAAQSLGISQPSLSQQLKIFESEVGSRLFVRNGRSFELSPHGQRLFDHSRQIFDSAALLSKFIEGSIETSSTVYRICVSDEMERPFVAEVVGKILKGELEPRRCFQVISKTHDEIAECIGRSEFDLYITNKFVGRKRPTQTFQFPVYLVTSKSQQQFKHFNENNLNSVFQGINEPIILPTTGMVLRNETDQALSSISTVPKVAFEINILSCAVRAIREGIGCGFLPSVYFQNDLALGLLSAVGPAKGYWTHKLHFYSNKRKQDSVLTALIHATRDLGGRAVTKH